MVGNNTHRPLDVDEFRGFTLFDAYAPLIFINARDSRSAQLFTLVHEAFHLLLGHETLTTDDLLTGDIHDRNERFCNEAAAEFLVPSKELKRMWRNDLERYEQITALARHFKVSRLVMIARCRGLGLLSPKAAAELWVREQAFLASRKKKGGGGDFFRTLVSRISAPFARAILSGVADSTISYTDAFRLLGVKSAKKLDTLNFLLSQRENDALSS